MDPDTRIQLFKLRIDGYRAEAHERQIRRQLQRPAKLAGRTKANAMRLAERLHRLATIRDRLRRLRSPHAAYGDSNTCRSGVEPRGHPRRG